MNYFLSNRPFCDRQFGFIKGRSTVLQLLVLLDEWTKILDKGGQIDIIYTDFEKAFDKVSHTLLLQKLQSYEIDKYLLEWIKSFLLHRTYSVKVNGKSSADRPVLSGIPQGSVLGPVLFIIFINDLPNEINRLCDIFMYADDAKMYKAITNYTDSVILNDCCDKLLQWSHEWLMKLNTNKCKIMTVSKSNKNIGLYDYNFKSASSGSNNLERVQSFKDLGVIFDKELSFNEHIYDKINMAYKILGIIRRNFNDMYPSTFFVVV
jgi:retron-type reverse transcriptase